MKNKRNRSPRRTLGLLTATAMIASTAALAATTQAASAQTDIYLCARPGVATVADPATEGAGAGVSVNFLGFAQVNSVPDCSTAIVQLDDPTPIQLVSGAPYTVHLINQTGEQINFSATGLTGAPDLIGVGASTKTYSFTAGEPGTYLYESNIDPRHTLVGLHGVIVVNPTGAAGTAHGTAVSQFDQQKVVFLTELDVSFNNDPAWQTADLNQRDPDLFLINGQTHTTNDPLAPIVAVPGENVLLRYVNAGSTNSSMAVNGLRQRLVAFDGEIHHGTPTVLAEAPQDVSQVFLSAGQTADAIVTVSGAAGDQIPIFNRNLRTSAVGDNGAQLLMIEVGTGGVAPTAAIYFSLNSAARNLSGTVIRDEDIGMWDGTTVSFAFVGAAHGLVDGAGELADVDAAYVSPGGNIYFSLRQDFPNPGGLEWSLVPDATLQENDIFKWDGTQMSVWLDGSTIGLNDNQNRHDINGVHVDELTGITSFTTNGSVNPSDAVPMATGSTIMLGARNEDVIRWVPVFPALPSGAGAFDVLFDGSDLGLAFENLDGLSLSGTDVLFSLTTEFNNGFAFDRDDLIACLGHQPPAPGSITDSCIAALSLEFDADVMHGTNAGQVDAYSIG